MAKDSFILYTEQKAVLDKLTDEQAGKLIKAIYEYEETGIMPELDTVLDLVITPFKTALDKNADKWEEIKQKRSEAGKIGAEKKKQKEAKEANANFDEQKEQKEANQAVYVNEDVNVSVNDNVNEDVTNLLSNKDVEAVQKTIIETLGNTNLTVIQEAISYLDDFPLEVIQEALVRTARKQKQWDYAKGTLNNWLKDGLDTLDKIKAKDLEFKGKNNSSKSNEKKKINDYEQREYDDFSKFYANSMEGG